MRRLPPAAIAAIAGVILILLLILLVPRGKVSEEDRLTEEEIAGQQEPKPENRCASQATYDRVKRELFRRAAQTRGSDQAEFDRLATYSVVRMQNPVLRSEDEELGTVRCAGRLALDLPPGVAAVGGRTSLSADIDYSLQPAADRSGDVVMLEGADPIIVPLATLSRTVAAPATAPGNEAALPPPVAAPVPPNAPAPPAAGAQPSFNCRYARTRSETAVCENPDLAALDRQMSDAYFRALSASDPRQRGLLERTRGKFLRFRDSCRNDACIAGAYRGRMIEIADILADRWQPN